MRAKPLPAPRNLDRLPESGSFETSTAPADVRRARRARRSGGAGGWCAATSRPGAITLSAEKGYSRETGNLIFHVALLVAARR